MWVLLWVLLSTFILGIFAWSMSVLFQQKKAWAAFAKKKKLKYDGGRLTSSPVIRGKLEGFNVSFYTDSQPTRDARGQRFVTVLEVEMGPGMPTGAAFATEQYGPFLGTIRFPEVFRPDIPEWEDSYIAKTRDMLAAKKYLTHERAKTIAGLFKMTSCIGLLFFDELEAVLRIETTDPLRDEQHLDKVARRILAAARILAPTEAEKEENRSRRLAAEERERARIEAEERRRRELEVEAMRNAPLKPNEEQK